MDSDQGKLFIGGISWETTEDKLKDYFGQYGDVLQTVVMRDKITGKPRGFGFVAFSDPSILDRVLKDTHTIDGRTVEAKKAMSREEQHTTVRFGNYPRNSGGGGNFRTKKIFVGGLPPTLSDLEFRKYFEAFGTVTDVVVMYDPNTQRPRGFGFISFDSEDSVDSVVQKQFHDVGGKAVEVKRALPKDANSSITSNHPLGGASYQSYGSTGYSAPVYGYGTSANGEGYGGFVGYGNTGAYGNPSGLGAGYAPPVAPRSSWNNQASSGYVSSGYGANVGYEGAGSWNAHGSGVPVSGHTGQPAVTATSYGNQGYGGSEGSYGNQGGYAASVGHGVGVGNSYGNGESAGSGYIDASGTTGYSNAWRSDTAQGGGYGAFQLPGYSGGYGGDQSRLGQ